jgi:hypothetical protein
MPKPLPELLNTVPCTVLVRDHYFEKDEQLKNRDVIVIIVLIL